MNKLIIIIHSSEIIRKGIAAILRSYFPIEILQLDDVFGLQSYKEMKNHNLIIIQQDFTENTFKQVKFLIKNNQVKLINFNNLSTSTGNLPPYQCDYSISLETAALEIQDIVSNCWKAGEKSVRSTDTDELSSREKEVLRLVAMGHSNKIIADKLFISIHTVISHRKNISEKTGIKSISGLTVYAILNNLIDTSTIDPGDLI
jgi:DNA-binding CsgD family transcriptional regulator